MFVKRVKVEEEEERKEKISQFMYLRIPRAGVENRSLKIENDCLSFLFLGRAPFSLFFPSSLIVSSLNRSVLRLLLVYSYTLFLQSDIIEDYTRWLPQLLLKSPSLSDLIDPLPLSSNLTVIELGPLT
jgi:hypothetical protein